MKSNFDFAPALWLIFVQIAEPEFCPSTPLELSRWRGGRFFCSMIVMLCNTVPSMVSVDGNHHSA